MRLLFALVFTACSGPSLSDFVGKSSSPTPSDPTPSEGGAGDTGQLNDAHPPFEGVDTGESDTGALDDSSTEAEDPLQCPADDIFPDPTWRTGLPDDHGMDPDRLALAASVAGMADTNCMVVVRHGTIVGEWYWQGTEPGTKVKNWSVAKAVSSAVVGVAIDRGDLDSVDQFASDFIPEWQHDDRSAIRIHDLLSMSSGLRFEMLADNVTMPLADDMTALAVNAPADNPPGALWEYNNHSVQAIEPILREATGMAPDDYADQFLFDPIGMSVSWKHDETGHPAMYMNANASCRDNARLAYLYLKKGCWDGDRVLSADWIEQSTSSSTSMNRGYGYWWWLNGEEPLLDSVSFEDKGRMMHPFAPHDAFCGVGLGNQFVEVIPSLDLVVVRLGTAPHDDLSAWLDPASLYEELTTDGEQYLHNNILELVLDAVVE
jgi:CubicO group peptidase (beta-lactamase class C family)